MTNFVRWKWAVGAPSRHTVSTGPIYLTSACRSRGASLLPAPCFAGRKLASILEMQRPAAALRSAMCPASRS
jgi:hypothetical protein